MIVVSGPGGSGKMMLAHRLTAILGCPALCRDEIQEGMVASNPGFVPAITDPLTVRAYHLGRSQPTSQVRMSDDTAARSPGPQAGGLMARGWVALPGFLCAIGAAPRQETRPSAWAPSG